VRLREWSEADYYAELGVSASATRDEITAAFRARARVLHPDTAPDDPAAEAQFHRAATAYRILTGPQREAYDQARARAAIAAPPRPAPTAPATSTSTGRRPGTESGHHLTRRGARGALGGGIGLIVLAFIAAIFVIALQVHDANLRSQGVGVTAAVVTGDGGNPELEFVTAGGRLVTTGIPDSKSGSLHVGDHVDIRYDADEPTRVVTQANTIARDITLWVVVAKFLIVGLVLVIVGARRLARSDARRS
jgi:DnaJ domain